MAISRYAVTFARKWSKFRCTNDDVKSWYTWKFFRSTCRLERNDGYAETRYSMMVVIAGMMSTMARYTKKSLMLTLELKVLYLLKMLMVRGRSFPLYGLYISSGGIKRGGCAVLVNTLNYNRVLPGTGPSGNSFSRSFLHNAGTRSFFAHERWIRAAFPF